MSEQDADLYDKIAAYDEVINKYLDGKATMEEVKALDPFVEVRKRWAAQAADKYYREHIHDFLNGKKTLDELRLAFPYGTSMYRVGQDEIKSLLEKELSVIEWAKYRHKFDEYLNREITADEAFEYHPHKVGLKAIARLATDSHFRVVRRKRLGFFRWLKNLFRK